MIHLFETRIQEKNLELVKKYDPPKLRQPFNLDARRLAGFDEAELEALQAQAT